MLNVKTIGAVLAFALSASSVALADEVSDAAGFRNLFLNEVRAQNPRASEDNVQALHFMPDLPVINALRSDTVDSALTALRLGTVPSVAADTQQLTSSISAERATPAPGSELTIVLVPGLFSEFIQNRAFEEVLAKDSSFATQFTELVAQKQIKDSVSLLANYQADGKITPAERDLDKVINVGEMQIGGARVRVVLFFTEFSTLESIGNNQNVAALFNERLEKYLQLTGPQNLAFVGYSRGTPLALEMLAQAKAAGRPWIRDVKAMISLSGVVWGSSLADDAYDNADSLMHKILMDIRDTGRKLQPLPQPSDSLLLNKNNRPVFLANNALWAGLLKRSVENYGKLNADKSPLHMISPFKSLILTDPRAPLAIVKRMWKTLGLEHSKRDYNLNITRFNYFVDQLLASVEELTTKSRVKWWREHDIPLNATYYAITGTMANPEAGGVESQLFANPLSYGGSNNYDDNMLLQNTLDYTKLTKPSANEPGITLNDSQVSVAQAAFLPNVIAGLRPSNAGVKTKFLGIAGTHHWGMALRVVNKNIFTGGANGFPREAMLRALATQVLLDN